MLPSVSSAVPGVVVEATPPLGVGDVCLDERAHSTAPEATMCFSCRRGRTVASGGPGGPYAVRTGPSYLRRAPNPRIARASSSHASPSLGVAVARSRANAPPSYYREGDSVHDRGEADDRRPTSSSTHPQREDVAKEEVPSSSDAKDMPGLSQTAGKAERRRRGHHEVSLLSISSGRRTGRPSPAEACGRGPPLAAGDLTQMVTPRTMWEWRPGLPTVGPLLDGWRGWLETASRPTSCDVPVCAAQPVTFPRPRRSSASSRAPHPALRDDAHEQDLRAAMAFAPRVAGPTRRRTPPAAPWSPSDRRVGQPSRDRRPYSRTPRETARAGLPRPDTCEPR